MAVYALPSLPRIPLTKSVSHFLSMLLECTAYFAWLNDYVEPSGGSCGSCGGEPEFLGRRIHLRASSKKDGRLYVDLWLVDRWLGLIIVQPGSSPKFP